MVTNRVKTRAQDEIRAVFMWLFRTYMITEKHTNVHNSVKNGHVWKNDVALRRTTQAPLRPHARSHIREVRGDELCLTRRSWHISARRGKETRTLSCAAPVCSSFLAEEGGHSSVYTDKCAPGSRKCVAVFRRICMRESPSALV